MQPGNVQLSRDRAAHEPCSGDNHDEEDAETSDEDLPPRTQGLLVGRVADIENLAGSRRFSHANSCRSIRWPVLEIVVERILEALQDLPADATVDDAIERLVFLAKIDAGLAELDEGKGIPHEEVKQRLGM